MTLLKIIEGWVVRYPKRILFLTLFLGASVVPNLVFLKNDPSPHLLPYSHPARQALQQLREDFTGTNSGVFIMLEAKDTIFKSNTLERIQRLTEAIQNMQLLSTEDLEDLNVIAEQLSGKEGLLLQKLLPKEVKDLNDMFWMEFEEMREILGNEGRWFPEWNSLLRNIEVRSAPVVEVTSISNTDDIYGSEEGLTIEKILK